MLMRKGVGYSYILYIHFLNGTNKFVMCPLFSMVIYLKIICSYENPTVSIIIPVYNAEGTITRCLDSIIHQTYSSIEVIIIDDGSSDLSGSICDNYATKYNYIQVIHKKMKELV